MQYNHSVAKSSSVGSGLYPAFKHHLSDPALWSFGEKVNSLNKPTTIVCDTESTMSILLSLAVRGDKVNEACLFGIVSSLQHEKCELSHKIIVAVRQRSAGLVQEKRRATRKGERKDVPRLEIALELID